ncbi:type II secretion system protein [uncultured Fibrobacter sp.]|uniref:type IV pilin protein n=1 Tax=uncultured Fibrobacter sp. TaxID=261512 RepID=UPI0025EE97DB|nr:type II secretion system protein [uncultured Fibrobacter sp.]
MKKQGFTLIELMVVIVIMGILAAVAVPKLFGMIAKSKASELGPAAGEYVKLQDAFISESGTTYGSWKFIGYTMTSNTVFKYFERTTENGLTTASTYAIPSAVTSTNEWKAQPQAALNNCQQTSVWTINIKKAASGNGAGYKVAVTGGPTGDCNILVPGLGKLDETGNVSAP